MKGNFTGYVFFGMLYRTESWQAHFATVLLVFRKGQRAIPLNTNFVVANMHLQLRPVQAQDGDFLFRVYASTRTEEMALVDWTDEQKTAFLGMQFNAQTEHYRIHYPEAGYFVVEREGVAVGRLSRELTGKQLLLMDLTLLPEYRNAGIGSVILRDLMSEAAQAGLPLVLRVEFFNPVIRLYTRLGFVKTREVNSVYHEMVWSQAVLQPDGGSA